MNQTIILGTVVLLVLIAFAGSAQATIITVDDSGGADYLTIKEALDAAVDGDTISVAAGTYTDDIWNGPSVTSESYRITKSVTLLGAQADIDPVGSTGQRTGGESILVRTNGLPYLLYAPDITINGFMIGSPDINTGGQLTISDVADNAIIKNCIIQNTPNSWNGRGVLLYPYADSALVEYNTFYNTTSQAIAGYEFSNAVITNNYISSCGDYMAGIQLIGNSGSDNVITHNHITGWTNGKGINYWGGSGADISHNTIDGASIMNDGIWLAAADGTTVSYNQISDTKFTGINIRNDCTSVSITNNDISNCGTGVEKHSGDIIINDNNIHGNNFGVRNHDSTIVNAENNWWGDNTGPYHPTTNSGGLGNPVSDNVDFEPWTGMPSSTTSIPEFPTIVLPAMVVLGLMFIFQRRQ